MRRRSVGTLFVVPAALVLSCLASCQAVFTYSPLSFLRRDPSAMTVEQQVEYATQALESGDETAVQAAYDALSEAAEADPENGDLQYTAAQLALELSGVGEVFTTLLSTLAGGSGGGADPFAVVAELYGDLELVPLGEAGELLLAAEGAEDPADLTATDYLVGAVGLLIAGAPVSEDPEAPPPDIVATLAENDNLDAAQDFLESAVSELPEDDPARALLQSLLDSIAGGGL